MTNDERSSKSEIRRPRPANPIWVQPMCSVFIFRISSFVIPSVFVIRHSSFLWSFVIRFRTFISASAVNTRTILIIEDDDLQYEIYEEALAKYNLVRVSTGSHALAQIPH